MMVILTISETIIIIALGKMVGDVNEIQFLGRVNEIQFFCQEIFECVGFSLNKDISLPKLKRLLQKICN